MSAIKVQRTVYYSPRKRRHYSTAKPAPRAEAAAPIAHFCPTEQGETQYDEYGRPIFNDPGWHFTEEPRLVAVRDRLTARYLRGLQA